MPKSLNKWIIGLVIGTTVAGVAKMASTEKGKSQLNSWKDKILDAAKNAADFVQGGLHEMKKHTDTNKGEKAKKLKGENTASQNDDGSESD